MSDVTLINILTLHFDRYHLIYFDLLLLLLLAAAAAVNTIIPVSYTHLTLPTKRIV